MNESYFIKDTYTCISRFVNILKIMLNVNILRQTELKYTILRRT